MLFSLLPPNTTKNSGHYAKQTQGDSERWRGEGRVVRTLGPKEAHDSEVLGFLFAT